MATTDVRIAAMQDYRSRFTIQKFLANYGLLLFVFAVIIGFSIALPYFWTLQSWLAILQANYIVVILAYAEAICVACGEFDLSVAYNLTLCHILCIGLIVNQGVPWYWAAIIAIVIAASVGLANGLIVYFWKINSFIVTLGMGTIVLGFAYLYTGGLDILPNTLPNGFISLESASPGGIPVVLIYVAAITLILVIATEFLPVGRFVYALGANRKAAILAGIRPAKYVIGVFVCSGVLVGLCSSLYGSQYRSGSLSSAPNLLLPIFTGAILGSSVIRPGRPNILGTFVAVSLLGIGLAGLLQLGYGVASQDLFNGLALILGVGFAGMAARRATTVREKSGTLALPSLPEDVRDIVPPSLLGSDDEPAP